MERLWGRDPYWATLDFGDVWNAEEATLPDWERGLTDWMWTQLGHSPSIRTQTSRRSSTELLLEETLRAGGDTYVCGGVSASRYLDQDLLSAAGVSVEVQDWQAPPEIAAATTIVEALAKHGPAKTRELLA